MGVYFSEIKQILNEVMADWTEANNRMPDLPRLHLDPTFGWETRDQLVNSKPFGEFPLIAPELIGTGRGNEANLVVALANNSGVSGLGRMPLNGPYLPQEKIQRIVQWIDEGALDDPPSATPEC